ASGRGRRAGCLRAWAALAGRGRVRARRRGPGTAVPWTAAVFRLAGPSPPAGRGREVCSGGARLGRVPWHRAESAHTPTPLRHVTGAVFPRPAPAPPPPSVAASSQCRIPQPATEPRPTPKHRLLRITVYLDQ